MRWEYYVHTISASGMFSQGHVEPRELTNLLNFYGNDGWELVSAFDTNTAHGGTRLIVLTFKRPHQLAAPPLPTR
jgi:hypothetical protein